MKRLSSFSQIAAWFLGIYMSHSLFPYAIYRLAIGANKVTKLWQSMILCLIRKTLSGKLWSHAFYLLLVGISLTVNIFLVWNSAKLHRTRSTLALPSFRVYMHFLWFWIYLFMASGPGEGSKRLGVRTTVAIIFARLILVPLAGVGIVMLVDKLGFIPKGDKMFKFVLLLQHTMPTSVLSGEIRHQGLLLLSLMWWGYTDSSNNSVLD
jgi:hypothetical protein